MDEAAVAEGNEFSDRLEAFANERQSGFARICAKLEEELQGLPDEEQAELLSSYGIDESGLVRIIHTGYATLGLYSYFTVGVGRSARMDLILGAGRSAGSLWCYSHRF